ncbi:hypothetical protein SAMN05421823_1237 [Catalinimonas alkaloidigena]|uniref:Uncharacterized protein n=1 Tax=Catalinimonas alkaloidigena TaxID=1075417 RepID=A0A1G9VQT9_9BACT|nr:hypothetical protein [Catalinimonas alkaloidigena]SDM74604.1 hypothetical protein SAMN05421823_1237 [Catalinimonas alkaloidigena]
MKDTITREDLDRLMAADHAPIISIYLPTHRSGHEVLEQQDQKQFKNLLKQARQTLEASGYDLTEEQTEAVFAPAEQLLDDDDFWRHREAGLALFLGQDLFVTHSLPVAVQERVVVDASGYIVPLASLLNRKAHYYILAVSQNKVRLFEATPYDIQPVPMDGDIPTSRAEAEQYEEPEESLQWRGGSTAQGGSARREGAMFHGQGGGKDTYKIDIERFFHDVCRPLETQLNRTQPLPLLFAGVEFEYAIFRNACHYDHLIKDRHIDGNPDDWSEKELHQKSLTVMEERFSQKRTKALEQIKEVGGTDQATENPYEIVQSALMGKVGTLFTANHKEVWGKIDPESFETTQADGPTPETHELINYAAIQTLTKGGDVFLVDTHEDGISLPANQQDSAMVALYRF